MKRWDVAVGIMFNNKYRLQLAMAGPYTARCDKDGWKEKCDWISDHKIEQDHIGQCLLYFTFSNTILSALKSLSIF